MRSLLTALPIEDARRRKALWDRLAAAVDKARACVASNGLKILIVEDESWAALDMEWVCRKLGHEVIGPAATREAALRSVERERPDVVLMSARLGDLDGKTVADEICRRFGVKTLLVGQTGIANVCETAPVEVLRKPFAPETLAAALKRVTD